MFKTLQQAYLRSHSSLLMVLAQRGPITVTSGTMQQVIAELQTLNWQSVSGETPGEIVFSIVDTKAAEETAPALTVKRIPDEDDMVSPESGVDAAIDAAIAQSTGDEVV